jgi:hypothetical protein
MYVVNNFSPLLSLLLSNSWLTSHLSCSFGMEKAERPEHTNIQKAWEQVLDEADRSLCHRPFRNGDPDWNDKLDNFVDSLRESASTSDGRTTVPDLPPPLSRPLRRGSGSTLATTTAVTNRDDGDSGVYIPDERDESQVKLAAVPSVLRNSVLSRTLKKVSEFMQVGDYHKAATYQNRAIGYRRMFSGDEPPDTVEICRDDMKLAEIYRKIGTPSDLQLAEKVLLGVIDRVETEELDSKEQKDVLLAELYHDLGHTYIQLEKLDEGCGYLRDAFDLMIGSRNQSMSLLRSAGIMLFRVYTNQNSSEAAEVIDEHAEETCGFSLSTLSWCQEHGFDTEAEGFRFDRRHPVKGTSPLHIAVEKGDLDVLGHMLRKPLNLEVRESRNRRTPLLIACSQQDVEVVKLLISHGADINVTDELSKNGLHLCQRPTGGTLVARWLLKHPSRTISVDATDSCQNTALHLAAELGNQPMVQLLLDMGARADIPGPGGFTPLMAAVQATMRSQDEKLKVLKALVEKGADPTLKYYGGQTAIDMANDGQIRRSLQNWSRPFSKPTRRFSIASWKS